MHMHVGKRHGNSSGNENRNARERADGKAAIVARNKSRVFAKTNSCREIPDAHNATYSFIRYVC
jgi:hypothetical protein